MCKQTDGHDKVFHDYMQKLRKLQAGVASSGIMGVASSGIMFKPRTVKTLKLFKS